MAANAQAEKQMKEKELKVVEEPEQLRSEVELEQQ